MMQSHMMAAVIALTAPLARRFGPLLPIGGQRGETIVSNPQKYTLADLVEHPAILVGMRCWGSDRLSLERLLETFAPRAASGMPATGSSDRGPVFFH